MTTYTFQVEVLAEANITVEANSYAEAEAACKRAARDAEELNPFKVDNIVCLLEGPDDE